MKSSRWTSRQLLQAAEMRVNSAKIQSEAAMTPVPGGSPDSMLESVLRLLKVTSLAMSAWMRSGEMCWRAAAMAGSAGAGTMGCWANAATVRKRQATVNVGRMPILSSICAVEGSGGDAPDFSVAVLGGPEARLWEIRGLT